MRDDDLRGGVEPACAPAVAPRVRAPSGSVGGGEAAPFCRGRRDRVPGAAVVSSAAGVSGVVTAQADPPFPAPAARAPLGPFGPPHSAVCPMPPSSPPVERAKSGKHAGAEPIRAVRAMKEDDRRRRIRGCYSRSSNNPRSTALAERMTGGYGGVPGASGVGDGGGAGRGLGEREADADGEGGADASVWTPTLTPSRRRDGECGRGRGCERGRGRCGGRRRGRGEGGAARAWRGRRRRRCGEVTLGGTTIASGGGEDRSEGGRGRRGR